MPEFRGGVVHGVFSPALHWRHVVQLGECMNLISLLLLAGYLVVWSDECYVLCSLFWRWMFTAHHCVPIGSDSVIGSSRWRSVETLLAFCPTGNHPTHSVVPFTMFHF